MYRLLAATMSLSLLCAQPLLSSSAFAQDDILDLDSEAKKKKKEKKAAVVKNELVREVERGLYAKANVGVAMPLLTYLNTVRPGTAISLGVGNDFVDQERRSMAWEVAFHQGVHNGLNYLLQADINDQRIASGLPPKALIQGDIRSFTLQANLEYSGYFSRRLGLGVRVGAGVSTIPVLMESAAYLNEVVQDTWNLDVNAPPSVHSQSVLPMFFGGPTFEYYTKLSHFSVGVDVDVSYTLGYDLGLNATGFIKYTF